MFNNILIEELITFGWVKALLNFIWGVIKCAEEQPSMKCQGVGGGGGGGGGWRWNITSARKCSPL